jgi:hypothetical protein
MSSTRDLDSVIRCVNYFIDLVLQVLVFHRFDWPSRRLRCFASALSFYCPVCPPFDDPVFRVLLLSRLGSVLSPSAVLLAPKDRAGSASGLWWHPH